MVSASIGRSIRKSIDFQCLSIVDPFTTPAAVVVINVEGASKLNLGQLKAISYPIEGDDSTESLESAIEYAQDENLKTLILDLSQGAEQVSPPSPFSSFCSSEFLSPQLNGLSSYFSNVKVDVSNVKSSLKLSDAAQKSAAEQCEAISALGRATLVELPAILNIRVNFEALLGDSAAYKEAVRVLSETIGELTESLKKSTGGQPLIFTVATKSEHKRARRAAEATEPAPSDDINLAKEYSENYPVIFNIILWFGVVMIFSLYAIAYAIAGMDPGRDSIIYRMTSTRIKKEN